MVTPAANRFDAVHNSLANANQLGKINLISRTLTTLTTNIDVITLPQYKDTQERIKEIDNIIEPLKKNRDVISIYLFGSYARGREKPFSDIDICVIADKHANRDEILSHSSKKIDIAVFHDLPLSMRFRVLKDSSSEYPYFRIHLYSIKHSRLI